MRFDRRIARWGSVVFVAGAGIAGAVGVLPAWGLVGALGVAVAMLILAERRTAAEDHAQKRRSAQLDRLHGILERKVRERTALLEDDLEQYRAIIENLDAVTFEYDVRRQRLLYIAPQATTLLECEPHELTSGFVLHCIHPDDRAPVAAVMLRGYHSGPIDVRLVTRSGRTVHTRAFISGRAGSRRLRGLVIDVTREKQLEHDLRIAHKLESVGRLAAGVAHEMNTPIQYIADSIDFVSDALADLDGDDAAYAREHIPQALGRAGIGVRQLAKIVRSMKAFAHDKHEVREVDLNKKIEDALAIATNEYRYVADVVIDLGTVPSVHADPADIQHVLTSIVVNAAQAIGEQQQRGTITVTSRALSDDVVVTIADTGPGIPDDVREHIFEPFFTTKDVGQGVGQALAVARSLIVDRYHGKLTFDTELGRGTTFTIRLPAYERSAAP